RHALAGASHSTGADQLVSLLPPATATAREHPRPLGPPPTDNGGVTVGGGRPAHYEGRGEIQVASAMVTGADQLVVLLCPHTAAAPEHPRRAPQPAGDRHH